MKKLILAATAVAATLTFGTFSAAAEVTECTEITSVPTTISRGGIYCFKGDIGTNLTSGSAITIAANNVTIEMNGYRLGGLAAGAATEASGISSDSRRNVTVRNGILRGFLRGIEVKGETSASHLYEDLLVDGNRFIGIEIRGSAHIVKNNRVTNTGPSALGTFESAAIRASTFSRSEITGNKVVNVTAGSGSIGSFGIDVRSGQQVEVLNNSVTNILGAGTEYQGIVLGSVVDSLIENNRVINTSRGFQGIVGGDFGDQRITCLNNFVDGFLSPILFCDTSIGNVVPDFLP